MTIRSFNGVKYLSKGVNSRHERVEDIGVVEEDEACTSTTKIVEGEVEGIVSTDEYPAYLMYKAKLQVTKPGIGQCTRCHTILKLTKVPYVLTAKIIIGKNPDGKPRILTLFQDTIVAATDGIDGEVGSKLIATPPLKYTVDSKDVVIGYTSIYS